MKKIKIFLKYMLIYFELFSLIYFIMNKSSYISNTNTNNIKNSTLFKFIKQNLINKEKFNSC